MPTVLGDFLAAADEHLQAAVVVGDGQVTELPSITRELHRLVAVMSHYLDDLTPYDAADAAVRKNLSAWKRVTIDADAALFAAADYLGRSVGEIGGQPDTTTSWRARHLAAAATQLQAGRDLLHTHRALGLDGVTRGRSEWALVVTSLPVTRALTSEIAHWSQQLAPFTAWLASSAMSSSPRLMPAQAAPAAVYDGLAGASQWLQVAGTAVLPAAHIDPVRPTDSDLLCAIPPALVPPRHRPDAVGESVTELCHGITISAVRMRAVVRNEHERATWSPAITSGGWQWMAQAAAITSHLSELALRSIATRAAELPASPVIPEHVSEAADHTVPMRAAWHRVDQGWDILVTETRQVMRTPVMTELSDLLLRMGRLVWDNAHWTPARADRVPRRLPADLAPDADAIRAVVAAVHQAVDALAGLAIIDLKAVTAADRARRLYVPSRLVPEHDDVTRRFVTAPAVQLRALQDAYQEARNASIMARLPLDEITIAARAPSMPLALARAAAFDQASRGSQPDDNDFLNPPPDYSPLRRSRASTGSAGPLEQAIMNRQVSDPVILLRAVVLDNTAERLIEQADEVTSAGSSPERRENWQRAVRRATVLADESFPHSPATRPPAETPHTRPSDRPARPIISHANSPSQHSSRGN
jgi:hypothetical protein